MEDTEPTVTEVIASARQMLDFVRLGARDYSDAGERRLSGLFNAVTSGRSVTFVLQKLKGRAPGFDQWYAAVQDNLRQDPVASWFVDLRNRIEKERTHGSTSASMYIRQFNPAEMVQNAPANATSMFLGDDLGRSGWTVQLQDGSRATVFFAMPASMGW